MLQSTINHQPCKYIHCMYIYIYVYMSTRINHPTNQSVYKIIYIYIIQKQPEIPAIRSAFFTNPVPCHSWVLTGRWLLMEPKTSRFHRAGMYRYEFHVWNHFRIFVFKKMARNVCGVKLQCWKRLLCKCCWPFYVFPLNGSWPSSRNLPKSSF